MREMSEQAAPTTALGAAEEAFGQNAWIVEEMHQQFLTNPASVDETWRAYFAPGTGNGHANGNGVTNGSVVKAAPAAVALPAVTNGQTNGHQQPAEGVAPAPVVGPSPAVDASVATPPAVSSAQASATLTPRPSPTAVPAAEAVEEPVALRGAAGRIVENMVTSLGVPTATSVHPLPAKLLEVNRRLINEHQDRIGARKISFTHLIAFALVKALGDVPALNSSFVADIDGKNTPGVIRHEHVNLGIAIDLERPGGARTLVVPAVRLADTLGFAAFISSYEDLVARARGAKLTVEDFSGVTVTITNPGTLGTTQSVPRLMSGQGAIIGVGALDFPVEFAGADPSTLSDLGIGKVLTLTSTYDHRIIQGAESGLFLKRVHELLVGESSFYEQVFSELGIAEPPARWQRAKHEASPSSSTGVREHLAVRSLIEAYRLHGHLAASVDPLAEGEPETPSVLDPATYGLSVWDLDRSFPTDGILASPTAPLSAILAVLRRSYCGAVGTEYVHIQDPDQRHFLAELLEAEPEILTPEEQRYLLLRLDAAEGLERFLQVRYPAGRRFSIEGSESTISFIDGLFEQAATLGIGHAVIGMAHRGRLNVLANVLGKPFEGIFGEFEYTLDPLTVEGAGDVKYHKGAQGSWVGRLGTTLRVTMPPNPSHLEAVDPVVIGVARAELDRGETDRVLTLLIHGDASFAGQGVVAETLNLSQLEGYRVGGTMHVIINNQLGFTAEAGATRSTRYSSDLGKAIEAPIFHVNGDDPEAVVRVAKIAEAYRIKFERDVIVDLISYRRMGHNEQDDPTYTQPLMYKLIDAHPTTRALYANRLLESGAISAEVEAADREAVNQKLVTALEATRALLVPHFDSLPPRRLPSVAPLSSPDSVSRTTLDAIAGRMHAWPKGFAVHPKIERQLLSRAEAYDAGEVDWALGEALAFGTLLLEGTNVRLTGQDSERGTFSHRQAVLIDVENGTRFTPLASLGEPLDSAGPIGESAKFEVRDSLLSEYAALGFEYGYSVASPEALVLWEAQFGDFANGAQIMIDNFIVAGEEKWGQMSGLIMLLPHGFEGLGPEHSSARIERYLQLAADGYITVVQPTTAAQFFHLLRTHRHQALRRPLIVFTPKSMLRARQARSTIDELVTGNFSEVLDDPAAGVLFERSAVGRVVLCTGKLAFELMDRNAKNLALLPSSVPVAVVRVEQLHPWPEAQIAAVLASYPGATEIVWAQDEPANMGAWSYAHPLLLDLLDGERSLRRVSRQAASAPATGSQHVIHDLEVHYLADAAVGPSPVA
jgi:2-oxoglutarate dehydrogenase E1 component